MVPQPADTVPTLKDVARAAGTSTAVVSYVMNNGPRPVSEKTRERVLAAASELDYRPNRIARALRARTTGVVGLVVPDASNPYFGALARQFEQALEEHEKLTLIGNAGYSTERQGQLVDRFLAAQVDGLVIIAADGASDVAIRARRAGVPAVYVHNLPESAQAPSVTADNDLAVKVAVAHLRSHGHTQIAFLSGPHDAGPVGQRRAAWETALDAHGHAQTGATGLLRCAYSRAAAAALTARLISEGAMPSALITATDEQAIGVLAGAGACGLGVPERLALISLDGTPEAAYTSPSLTAMEQPMHVMAQRAVDLLLTGTSDHRLPQARLVARQSCGCTPATPAAAFPGDL